MFAILAGALALASPNHPAEHKAPTVEHVLEMMDANGDGVVTMDEYKAHKGDEADEEHFADVAGEDGIATPEEIEAAIAKYHSDDGGDMKHDKKHHDHDADDDA